MTVSIDYGNTNVINVQQADLTLVSGTIYELDTNFFRFTLKALESAEAGIVFTDTNIHNTEVTIAGTTFARGIQMISPYSVEFEDGQYTVILRGSNNNIFDVLGGILVQNQVQVIPTNSAGLQTVTSGSGVTAQDKIDIANETLSQAQATPIHANVQKMNDADVLGSGTSSDKWRGE